MWVASGVSITRTISNSTRDGSTSNSHRPPLSSNGLERPLRRVRAMHQHVPVPGGGLRLLLARLAEGNPVAIRVQRCDTYPKRIVLGLYVRELDTARAKDLEVLP